jgi:hypothetical protein
MDARIRTLAFLAFLAVDLPAQTASPREVRVVFDESASDLPQAEIRASVERELARGGVDPGRSERAELHVGVNADGALVLSYGAPGEAVSERVLRRPERAEDVAELVALATATLVRRQSGELASAPPSAEVKPAPPGLGAPALQPKPDVPGRAAPPRSPAETAPRSFFGVALGADLLFLPTITGACHPSRLEPEHGMLVECFGPGDQPLTAVTEGKNGAVASGYATGTSRLVLSFDQAFTAHFRAGVRLGIAFDPIPLPYFPLHAEVKIAHVFGLPGSGAWRPELFAGAGLARATGQTKGSVFDDRTNAVVPVDIYASAGWFFVSGGGGLVYQATSSLELEGSLELMGFFPQTAVSLTPWIGARFGV